MAVEERKIARFKSEFGKGVDFNKEQLEIIRRTVAKGATEDEFNMFIHLAETYGLDPLGKEIWFIKKEGERPIIMTSRDGYLKIADRHPAYDGIVSDVVRKNDIFKRSIDGIQHEYSTDRGTIIGAYALLYRKDRKYPVYVFAPFDEYFAGTKVWNQYPSAMILKCAESMALKRAFTVSGLVSSEEMDVQLASNYQSGKGNDEINSGKRELSYREEVIKDIVVDSKELKEAIYTFLIDIREESNLDKVSINDLTDSQYQELKKVLQQKKG